MKENNVEFQLLHVKNSLLKQYLMKNQKLSHLNSVETLCQGPNFLLGCKEVDNVKKLWDFLHTPSFLIKKTEMPSFLFMGCFYKNQILNHLDFGILLKTDLTIYQNLLLQLEKKSEIYTLLHNSLFLTPLLAAQSSLLMTFSALKAQKTSKNH